MTGKPIYEFLMWDNCNNNCKFCFQRLSPRNFDLDTQHLICNSVISYLKSDNYISGNHVLIVGGEIFDNIDRKNFLLEFFDNLTLMMSNRYIDLLYLNTNIIYNDVCMSMLSEILDLFKKRNVLNRLKFTTSYDLDGRFRNKAHEDLFLKNLDTLSSINELNIVSNLILTNTVCKNILDDKFNIFEFQDKHRIKINMIPYIVLDQNLGASRKLIFDCLRKLDMMNSEFIKNFIFELDMKQPRKLLQSTKDGSFIEKTCKNSDCGHSVNFKRYSNAESCFVCDIKMLFNKYY